jgi:hypothetical protein
VGGGVLLFGGTSAVLASFSGWFFALVLPVTAVVVVVGVEGVGVGWWGVSARCWVLRDQAVDPVGLVAGFLVGCCLRTA